MALKVGELFASFDLDASGMTGTIRTIETQLEGIGADMIRAGSTLSSMVTDPLKGIGKSILSAGMDFTSQMSRVEAISGASAAEMEKLNAEALKMGSTTQFTATEAGQALEYMAMAGWKTSAMINGLEPIMNLAAASGENLADVSDIVTDAMTAFGLEAKKENIARFSDVLAQAASNSNTNVGLMGETFKYVAPVAGALGYNIEDAAIAIGLMANAGIKGSQSGTALRALLTRLSKPTKEVKTAMKELGLSMTTSTGEMKPLRQLMTEMRGKFSGLTEQEKALYAATLAGQEGMSGLLAIVSASDKDFNKLAASIDNCKGATGRMAATVLANAKGDWTLFQSAVEGAYVALFTLNEQAIRKTIQSMTGLVDKFNALDGPMKQVILKTGILAAAIGPVLMYGGKALMLAGKIAPAIAALVSPLGIVAGTFLLFGAAAMDAGNDMGKAFEKYT
ncbi:MAG: phage tail tape measure protein, partial [Christensenellales bacterium]|nr:phage tail tape measure protein [Christensenellales bacterium]